MLYYMYKQRRKRQPMLMTFDLDNETEQQTAISTVVKNYSHEHNVHTKWEIICQILDQYPNYTVNETWGVIINLDMLYALISYKGVPAKNITYMTTCANSTAIAKKLGCHVVDISGIYKNSSPKKKDSIINRFAKFEKLSNNKKQQLLKELEQMKKFKNTISNVPYNVRSGDGGIFGTIGDKMIGRKLNALQVELTEDGGYIGQMGLKTNMMTESVRNENFNPQTLSLMTDKDYWNYNTFWVVGRKEPNQYNTSVYQPNMISQIAAKVINVMSDPSLEFDHQLQNLSLMQLERDGYITYEPNGNPKVIVRNVKEADPILKYAYPTEKGMAKLVTGPKFMHYMQEAKKTHLATDESAICELCHYYPTSTVQEAENMKLFIDNNPIVDMIASAMNLKASTAFLRKCIKFDLGQIVTGREMPAEWNLSDEEIAYIFAQEAKAKAQKKGKK